MSLRDIFKKLRGATPKSGPQRYYSALIDTSDYTVVTLGTFAPALFFVNECMMDTEYVPGLAANEDMRRALRIGPRAYPELSWVYPDQTFKKTNPDIITEDMRAQAVLATRKMRAAEQAIFRINRLRAKTDTGFLFQHRIYTEKEKQAQRLKDADFDEGQVTDAPYVAQYAAFSGLSIRQAAEEILFQAQLDNEYLVKTEKTRLMILKKIKQAKTPKEVEDVMSAFRKTGAV